MIFIRFRRWLRLQRIRRLEQDLAWCREHADSYIASQARRLADLRARHDQRTAQEIARDVARRAKEEVLP